MLAAGHSKRTRLTHTEMKTQSILPYAWIQIHTNIRVGQNHQEEKRQKRRKGRICNTVWLVDCEKTVRNSKLPYSRQL